TEQYGEKYAKIAQDLAEKSKGKKIQGVDNRTIWRKIRKNCSGFSGKV
ncbi:hypothetical protein DTL94_28585, partial [Escherichia coli]